MITKVKVTEKSAGNVIHAERSINMGTIIVLLILIAIVSAIIRTIIKDKKSGKSSCGGNCGKCGGCH